MFGLNDSYNYYLYPGYVPMGKGLEGLSELVRHAGLEVLNGDVFLFVGRRRDTIKLLRWDHDGFILYQKRLEKGTFEIPRFKPSQGWLKMNWKHFFLMMSGVSLQSAKFRERFQL